MAFPSSEAVLPCHFPVLRTPALCHTSRPGCGSASARWRAPKHRFRRRAVRDEGGVTNKHHALTCRSFLYIHLYNHFHTVALHRGLHSVDDVDDTTAFVAVCLSPLTHTHGMFALTKDRPTLAQLTTRFVIANAGLVQPHSGAGRPCLPLALAIRAGHIEVVRCLLEARASPFVAYYGKVLAAQ